MTTAASRSVQPDLIEEAMQVYNPTAEIMKELLAGITKMAEVTTVNLYGRAQTLSDEAKKQANHVQEAINQALHATVDGKRVAFDDCLREMEIALEASSDPSIRERAKDLIAYIEHRDAIYREMIESATKAHQMAAEAMMAMVVEFQFQDRAAQQVQNAVSLLEGMLSSLAVINKGIGLSKNGVATRLLESMTLSEFRKKLLLSFKKNGILKDAPVLEESAPANNSDDVDLF
jgi:hypothetical protein